MKRSWITAATLAAVALPSATWASSFANVQPVEIVTNTHPDCAFFRLDPRPQGSRWREDKGGRVLMNNPIGEGPIESELKSFLDAIEPRSFILIASDVLDS